MAYENEPTYGKKKRDYSGQAGYKPSAAGYERRDKGYETVSEEEHAHLREARIVEPPRVHEEKVVSTRFVPRVEEDRIQPLRLVSSEVIGGIFDRVDFLQKRIDELRQNIETRNAINKNILNEIEKDIDDRVQFLNAISDSTERRNLKLDISVLRKERRNENVQYWRDLVELNTELRKLEEEYQIEAKIAGIFGKLRGDIE